MPHLIQRYRDSSSARQDHHGQGAGAGSNAEVGTSSGTTSVPHTLLSLAETAERELELETKSKIRGQIQDDASSVRGDAYGPGSGSDHQQHHQHQAGRTMPSSNTRTMPMDASKMEFGASLVTPSKTPDSNSANKRAIGQQSKDASITVSGSGGFSGMNTSASYRNPSSLSGDSPMPSGDPAIPHAPGVKVSDKPAAVNSPTVTVVSSSSAMNPGPGGGAIAGAAQSQPHAYHHPLPTSLNGYHPGHNQHSHHNPNNHHRYPHAPPHMAPYPPYPYQNPHPHTAPWGVPYYPPPPYPHPPHGSPHSYPHGHPSYYHPHGPPPPSSYYTNSTSNTKRTHEDQNLTQTQKDDGNVKKEEISDSNSDANGNAKRQKISLTEDDDHKPAPGSSTGQQPSNIPSGPGLGPEGVSVQSSHPAASKPSSYPYPHNHVHGHGHIHPHMPPPPHYYYQGMPPPPSYHCPPPNTNSNMNMNINPSMQSGLASNSASVEASKIKSPQGGAGESLRRCYRYDTTDDPNSNGHGHGKRTSPRPHANYKSTKNSRGNKDEEDESIPDFQALVNFPYHVTRRSSSSTSQQARQCVMCGETRLSSHQKKDQDEKNDASANNGDGSASANTSKSSPSKHHHHIIPKQNKGLCTACDVAIWTVAKSGLQIKWCKGCKNFKRWAMFGEKSMATKCSKCRTKQKEKYAKKVGKENSNDKSRSVLDSGPVIRKSSTMTIGDRGGSGLSCLIAATNQV